MYIHWVGWLGVSAAPSQLVLEEASRPKDNLSVGGGCVYFLPLEAERHQHGDVHHCSLLGPAEDLHHKGVP